MRWGILAIVVPIVLQGVVYGQDLPGALPSMEAPFLPPPQDLPKALRPPESAPIPLVYDTRVSFYAQQQPPLMVRDFSWAYIDHPKAREIKVHDLITVVVKEAAETMASSVYNRQRNGQYTADLQQFIRINSEGNLDTAALQSPQVNSQLQSRLQSMGTVTESEAMKYRIAATVVDVLPNGILVLEARKSIVDNKDLWEYSLTGKVRPEDILPDNTALSERIADLSIKKGQHGKLHDSTQRAWFIHLYDLIGPF